MVTLFVSTSARLLQIDPPLPPAPPDVPSLLAQLYGLVVGHQWLPIVALVIGWMVAMLSSNSKFPFSVPDSWNPNRWKPVAVVVLTAAFYGLEWSIGGMPWEKAVASGVRAVFFTLGGYAVFTKAIFGGNVPQWLQVLALIFPPKPALAPRVPVFVEPSSDKVPPAPPSRPA